MKQTKTSQFIGRHKGAILLVFSVMLLSGIASASVDISDGEVSTPVNVSITYQDEGYSVAYRIANSLYTIYDDNLRYYFSFDTNRTFGNRWVNLQNQSSVQDDSGNVNWTDTGKYGGAAQFPDTTNGYIYIGNKTNIIEGGDQFTVLAWVYPVENKSAFKRVVQKQFDKSWALMESSLKTRCYINTTNGGLVYASNVAGNVNQWNLIGCVYNGTDLIPYINGQIRTGGSITGNVLTSTNEAEIGAPSLTINGSIDEVMLFNKSLSLTELNMIYNGSYRFRNNLSDQQASISDVEFYKPYKEIIPPITGTIDSTIREIGNIIKVGDVYKLFYSGYNGTYEQNHVYVHWANSTDGINWVKQGLVVANASEDPYMVYNGSQYFLYVEDKNVSSFANITLYTSTDFVTWDSYGTVLSTGDSGSWDATDVSSPVVYILPNSTWVMLYEGRAPSQGGEIGIATSQDGYSWVKHESNPFIRLGATGNWDSASTVPDDVWFDGSTYHITRHGIDILNARVFSGITTTTDLLLNTSYSEHINNPIDTADTTMFFNSSDGLRVLTEAYTSIYSTALMKSSNDKWVSSGTIDEINLTNGKTTSEVYNIAVNNPSISKTILRDGTLSINNVRTRLNPGESIYVN